CLKSGVTVSNAQVTLLGSGTDLSVLSACNTDVSPVTLNNANHSIIQNLQILGKGSHPTDTYGATKPALNMIGCGGCLLHNIIVLGGYNSISANGGGDMVFYKVTAGNSYGSAAIYLTGVSAYIERVAAGNDWAAPGVACCGNLIFIGWRPNHAYSVGDVVSNS